MNNPKEKKLSAMELMALSRKKAEEAANKKAEIEAKTKEVKVEAVKKKDKDIEAKAQELKTALKEVEAKETGVKVNLDYFSNNLDEVNEFIQFLKLKKSEIKSSTICTAQIYKPVKDIYKGYIEDINKILNQPIFFNEVINEALIRYMKEVLEQQPVYLKIRKELDNIKKRLDNFF